MIGKRLPRLSTDDYEIVVFNRSIIREKANSSRLSPRPAIKSDRASAWLDSCAAKQGDVASQHLEPD